MIKRMLRFYIIIFIFIRNSMQQSNTLHII